jgi:hypothetical protein
MIMGIATKGILQKKRSEILAKTMAETAAATYGGADVSWAFVALKPMAFVIVGSVNLVPAEELSWLL